MKPTISSVTYNKLRKRLRRNTGRAIEHYNMIEDGDRIMVCLSGGKDSYTLLDILLALKASAPVDFELVAVNLDQGHPGFPQQILPEYCESINVKFHQISKDTYSVVKSIIPENKTMCSLCSRLRRGTLYGFAEEHGFNKIALGHHRDDIIETLFLNMFFGGHLKAMPAKLRSDDKKNTIIRPLAYCNEQDISKYAQYLDFPIIPCDLCGSQDSLQRQQIKNLLQDWDKQFPGRVESIFSSIQNVAPSQLMDRELFDFNTFERQSSAPVKAELNSWLMPTKDDDTNVDSKKDLSKQDNKDSTHQGSGVKIQVTKNTVPL